MDTIRGLQLCIKDTSCTHLVTLMILHLHFNICGEQRSKALSEIFKCRFLWGVEPMKTAR